MKNTGEPQNHHTWDRRPGKIPLKKKIMLTYSAGLGLHLAV